jgi:glucose-6-phosphate isomerase
LKPYGGPLNIHFVSNVDGTNLSEILKKINAETSLFVLNSKNLSDQETLINALSAKQWFIENTPNCCNFIENHHHQTNHHLSSHFVAITMNKLKAAELGIDDSNTFDLWAWVGERYALWSAVGLPIALYIGFDNFEKFLDGAHFNWYMVH